MKTDWELEVTLQLVARRSAIGRHFARSAKSAISAETSPVSFAPGLETVKPEKGIVDNIPIEVLFCKSDF